MDHLHILNTCLNNEPVAIWKNIWFRRASSAVQKLLCLNGLRLMGQLTLLVGMVCSALQNTPCSCTPKELENKLGAAGGFRLTNYTNLEKLLYTYMKELFFKRGFFLYWVQWSYVMWSLISKTNRYRDMWLILSRISYTGRSFKLNYFTKLMLLCLGYVLLWYLAT